MSVKTKSILIILALLIIDQWSKIYIKLHFPISHTDIAGEHNVVEVFSWFKITFIENEGAAFGMKIIGKLFLTLFRIIAIVFLAIFIHKLIKRNARSGYILAVSILLAGAVGNLLDSIFYGVLFSASTDSSISTFLPAGGGYAPLLYGKVVDMFYFPIIHDSNGDVIFFKWIFNFADSYVNISVFLILLFFRKDLNESLENKKTNSQLPNVEE